MHILETAKRWIAEITEIALLLVAFGIVAEILLGSEVMIFGGIVGNLTNLITKLGENGLVGLVALGVIIYLFNRRQVVAQQHHQ